MGILSRPRGVRIAFGHHRISRPRGATEEQVVQPHAGRADPAADRYRDLEQLLQVCVIRDPFEKAISAFEHLGRNHAIRRGPRGLWFRLRHRGYTAEQLRFLHWLTLGRRAIDRDKYLIGATFCLDDVVRYESLETDLARICDRLGVAWEPARLPRLKSEFRRQTSTISRLYTAPALRLVAQAYDFEIARFGYEFPGGRRATMPDKTVVSDPPVLP